VSRLLFLLPSVPDPPDAGAKLRNLGLVRLAAEEHTVDVIAFGNPADEARLATLGNRTCVLPTPAQRTRALRAKTVVSTDLPDMAMRLWSTDFQRAVANFVEREHYAAVQAEAIEMARYLISVPPEKRVYDAHNPEFLLQRRASEEAASVQARLYSQLQWRRLERFERAVVRASRMTIAVSEHDANQLLALAGDACITVVPNGIDTSAYTFQEPRAEDMPNVLFLGKLDYRPNAEALGWLMRDVMPAVFEAVPQARLFAVGANPPPWLVRAGQHDPRIAVTGYVPDERPYLDRCAVLVLPLRVAAGSRLKALIGMASGVPIVSTVMGMEGLIAQPGEHYVNADTAEAWIQALRRMLTLPEERATLARRARALVEQHYDWSAIRPALHAAYASLPND
jgi:glycosyltransferase involved in cell wall biosynthesis